MVQINLYAMEVKIEWNTEGKKNSEIWRIRKRRAIAVYNLKRAELDIEDLNDKIETVKKIIATGRTGKDLIEHLGGLRSYVKIGAEGPVLNDKKIAMMKKIAGRFMIVTNTDLAVKELVESFKDLWKIERSFRTIKSFIEIRPVNHRKSDRIKAHVFVCVLSLLLSRFMKKRIGEKETVSRISAILGELKLVTITTGNGDIVFRTDSESARAMLGSMKIPYPEKILLHTNIAG